MDCPADLASAAKQHRIRATLASPAGSFVCYLRRAADGQIITARTPAAGSAFDLVEGRAAVAGFKASMLRRGVNVSCVIC